MLSFRQIRPHFPALLIDAASSLIQVGILGPDGTSHWQTSTEESGVGIFQCIEKLGTDPQEVTTFIFCEGPGSVLGIRTAAMAIRTWTTLKPRPVFAYGSLALVAHALGRAEVGIISDARRDSWHHYQIGRGLRRVATPDLAGELAMPENFRHWSGLPDGVIRVPYSVAALLPIVADIELFRETDAPDAFLHEEPSYVMWTPRIHRAPSA